MQSKKRTQQSTKAYVTEVPAAEITEENRG